MPNNGKILTAKVKVDISDAEKKLARLASRIKGINKATAKSFGKTGLEQGVDKTLLATERLRAATAKASLAEEKLAQAKLRTAYITNKVASGNERIASAYKAANSKVQNIVSKVKEWWSNQTKVTRATKGTNSILGSIWSKLKGIAATYLGIMGAKAVINTSDTITKAQNKLNYVNANSLGSAGYTSDGSGYSSSTINATSEAMDKMYASSQRVRMGYDDMMKNVSKSMVLAGDAFDGSIDNAIRFQEIMAEAYAVGGASAQEMSTSMYQLIQALGSGTLAGDELRSVREGASLAYQNIEKFVQGVYDSKESLKDLASQGKVTSDMVVAAVMNMGDELDDAFSRTKTTFEGTWNQIKNAAIKAFEPVAEKLNSILNNLVNNGLVEKIGNIFVGIANVLLWVIDVVAAGVAWMVDNWYWLQYVVLGVILVIIAHLIRWTLTTIASSVARIAAYMMEHWQLLLIVAAIVALIAIYVQWKKGAIDTCTAIVMALSVVALAIVTIGALTGSTATVIVGIVIALVALVLLKISEILGCFYWLGAGVENVWNWIATAGTACCAWIETAFSNSIYRIVGFFVGLAAAAAEIAPAISDTFKWIGDKIKYWIGEAIVWCARKMAELLGSFSFGGLSLFGEEVIPKIKGSDIFGDSISRLNSITNDSSDPGSLGAVWSGVGDAFTSARDNYVNSKVTTTAQEAWNKEWAKYIPKDLGEAYNEGFQRGEEIKNKLNDWGEQFQTGGNDFNLGSLLGQLAGIDDGNGGLPDPNDPKWGAGGSYNFPSNDELLGKLDGINDGVGGIGSNTGSIAKSMDLAEEDLKFLRELAEKEWKKEYTTASITVDMSNFNTINKDGDLDGIVTKLRDKLYEEMNSLADGVYA